MTTQNLTVHAVDADKNLLLIKGAVPGPKGGLLVVKSAVKSTVPTERAPDDHRLHHLPRR